MEIASLQGEQLCVSLDQECQTHFGPGATKGVLERHGEPGGLTGSKRVPWQGNTDIRIYRKYV